MSLSAIGSSESVTDGVVELSLKRRFDRGVVDQKSDGAMTQHFRNEGHGRPQPRGLGADPAKLESDFAFRHFFGLHPELNVRSDR